MLLICNSRQYLTLSFVAVNVSVTRHLEKEAAVILMTEEFKMPRENPETDAECLPFLQGSGPTVKGYVADICAAVFHRGGVHH